MRTCNSTDVRVQLTNYYLNHNKNIYENEEIKGDKNDNKVISIYIYVELKRSLIEVAR